MLQSIPLVQTNLIFMMIGLTPGADALLELNVLEMVQDGHGIGTYTPEAKRHQLTL